MSEVDPPTYRLGTFLAIVYAVQFVAHLLGIGVPGVRFEVFHLLLIAAAVALRQGRRWGRTVFVVLGVAGLLLVPLVLLFLPFGAVTLLILLLVGGVVFVHLVAAAFTVPDEGVALGLPERWRPWATGLVLHGFILVTGLLSTFQSGF